jgi:glycosyltransferase involved in cell wall biosynthesis
MRKKVSIVIPTFNRSEYLKKAIDSALDQTYKCEVIVCDHGSTDDTRNTAKSYGNSIKYIRREKDFGIHFMWLDGIMNATGDYIHINFDDDWIAPTFIEETLNLFNDDVAFVFSVAEVVNENDKNKKTILFKNLFKDGINKSKGLEKYLLGPGCLISPSCGIHRKSELINNLFIGNIPGANNSYKGVGPDLLFSLSPLLKYKYFGFVNKPLAFFLAHDNSITIDASKDVEKKKNIINAYNDAKIFYIKMKLLKNQNLIRILFLVKNKIIMLSYRINNKIKKILRNI